MVCTGDTTAAAVEGFINSEFLISAAPMTQKTKGYFVQNSERCGHV